MSLELLGTCLPKWRLCFLQKVKAGEPYVLWFDVRNIEVLGLKDLQVLILIQKVENSVEPRVGQWVGSVEFASLV